MIFVWTLFKVIFMVRIGRLEFKKNVMQTDKPSVYEVKFDSNSLLFGRMKYKIVGGILIEQRKSTTKKII